MLFLEKGRVCTCVFMCVCVLEGVCVVSGPVIEPCQAPRAKPGLLDRNCLFTGYTTVYLKTIGLAGLLHRTPFRYRSQTSSSSYPTSLLYFSHFLNCLFFFKFAVNLSALKSNLL